MGFSSALDVSHSHGGSTGLVQARSWPSDGKEERNPIRALKPLVMPLAIDGPKQVRWQHPKSRDLFGGVNCQITRQKVQILE